MKSTHCIFYVHTDKDYRDTKETNGRCLDNTDPDGRWIDCATTIASGRCSKKRKSPVL